MIPTKGAGDFQAIKQSGVSVCNYATYKLFYLMFMPFTNMYEDNCFDIASVNGDQWRLIFCSKMKQVKFLLMSTSNNG